MRLHCSPPPLLASHLSHSPCSRAIPRTSSQGRLRPRRLALREDVWLGRPRKPGASRCAGNLVIRFGESWSKRNSVSNTSSQSQLKKRHPGSWPSQPMRARHTKTLGRCVAPSKMQRYSSRHTNGNSSLLAFLLSFDLPLPTSAMAVHCSGNDCPYLRLSTVICNIDQGHITASASHSITPSRCCQSIQQKSRHLGSNA